MPEAQLSSYEEIPYESKPLYPTHPDCLATVASLMGMRPAAVDRCRVLELGCASGGNLIPMAQALPRSHFIGIESAYQAQLRIDLRLATMSAIHGRQELRGVGDPAGPSLPAGKRASA